MCISIYVYIYIYVYDSVSEHFTLFFLVSLINFMCQIDWIKEYGEMQEGFMLSVSGGRGIPTEINE